MPDEIRRHFDALAARAGAQINRALADRGYMARPGLTLQRNAAGAGTSVESDATFVTGYDGTDTVSAFILDYSVLDGDDVLVG